MDIIKNLKDYKLSNRQRIFAGFLKEKVNAYNCSEKITNKDYLRQYFSPDNEFLIYTTAIADPARIAHWNKPAGEE